MFCCDVFIDLMMLLCNYIYCFECVVCVFGGKLWDVSVCLECVVLMVMKDLSVNMMLKSFVENFKSVDAELREALGVM